MNLFIHPAVEVRDAGAKGRGVFARNKIAANTIIEVSPVIVLNPKHRRLVEQTELFNYIFAWGDGEDQAALALGYISVYNHASPSNCEYQMDYEQATIKVVAMKAIAANEELCINYAADWHMQKPVWFPTV